MAVAHSGTGKRDDQGALAIQAAGGHVVVQELAEAWFDGMSRAVTVNRRGKGTLLAG